MADLPVIAELTQYPPAYDGPLGDQLADVLSEVASERWRQDQQWGGPAHDDRHTPMDWDRCIRRQLNAMLRELANGGHRGRLVNIAALSVAAIQSMDRLAARQEASAHG